MTTEKAIKMINEYLAEPNSIHKDWIEVLILCRQALEKQTQTFYCGNCGQVIDWGDTE